MWFQGHLDIHIIIINKVGGLGRTHISMTLLGHSACAGVFSAHILILMMDAPQEHLIGLTLEVDGTNLI
tara:strand:+ start:70 stop:276 length:207 start_codon:yes stop_codon:yes gene_type:complete